VATKAIVARSGHDPGLDARTGLPVTVVRVSPARVVQVKTPEKRLLGRPGDVGTVAFNALQARTRHFEKAASRRKKLVELRLDDVSVTAWPGDPRDAFEKGEMIDCHRRRQGKVSPVP